MSDSLTVGILYTAETGEALVTETFGQKIFVGANPEPTS
jgi:hypothetical protein